MSSGQCNPPLDKAAYQGTYARTDEFSADQVRERYKKSGMHFDVVKEGNSPNASNPIAESGKN
jgi:hypothetical protein